MRVKATATNLFIHPAKIHCRPIGFRVLVVGSQGTEAGRRVASGSCYRCDCAIMISAMVTIARVPVHPSAPQATSCLSEENSPKRVDKINARQSFPVYP